MLITLFWMHKMTGETWTHRESLFWYKTRCFACKNHWEGWNPYSLFILALITLLCVLKTTVKVWDQYRLVSLVLKSLFYTSKNTQMRAGTHIDLSFWCKSRCFVCPKRQVRSRTHRDLLFRGKSRCFASKNRRWGQGPIETSNSEAGHAVLHAENH